VTVVPTGTVAMLGSTKNVAGTSRSSRGVSRGANRAGRRPRLSNTRVSQGRGMMLCLVVVWLGGGGAMRMGACGNEALRAAPAMHARQAARTTPSPTDTPNSASCIGEAGHPTREKRHPQITFQVWAVRLYRPGVGWAESSRPDKVAGTLRVPSRTEAAT